MNFLKKKFYEYYLHPDIIFPPRFDRREFAFFFFGEDMMKRHISFKDKEKFIYYLRANVPKHIYYSSAYYRQPDAETMSKKQWMGADLIFDLDADHLPNANKMTYEEMLLKVKEEMKKLLDFLIEDFGFEKKSMALYFSGGRGYHCHVFDKHVIELGSQERREIVDYITARGLDFSHVILKKNIYANYYTTSTIEIMPSQPGWRGRMARGIISFLQEIKKMDREEAIKKLMEMEGIGKKIAMSIYDGLDEEKMKRIEEGKIDQMPAIRRLLKPLIKELAVVLHSSTDEPVTADVKRLIRLPGSLHGKTGFKVTKVSMDALEEFEPLRDAIVFGNDLTKIKVEKPFKIKMMGKEFNLKEGETRVPEYLAVFAIARGFGKFFK